MQKQDNKFILKLKKELINLAHDVGEIEYTKNNYDNDKRLINEKIPTITTEHCEIGKYNNNCYFVFVIFADSFNKDFFKAIKEYKNIQIYDFIDFNKTLYPTKDFDYNEFTKFVAKNEYLQIQFDFVNPKIEKLVVDYQKSIDCFQKYNVNLVNQLNTNLLPNSL